MKAEYDFSKGRRGAVMTLLALLVALPIGAALHGVDRLIFRSPRLSGLSEVARTALVILAGIVLLAAVMVFGYLLCIQSTWGSG